MLKNRQRNFSSYCMVCHGLDGQATGAAAQFSCSPGLHRWTAASNHPERNLAVRHARIEGDVNDEQIWQILLYVRHLPPKGSLGEPQVYGGKPSKQLPFK